MHDHEAGDDETRQQLFLPTLRSLEVRSLLDVGSATDCGLPRLAESLSNALVCGVEPLEALVRQGISSGVNKGLPLLLASGDALPFPDQSFDAVCKFGIFRHVPDPSRVVQEMLRVARKVVVISGAKRFGQGPFPLRLAKLLLYKLKLWNAFDFLRTRGQGYQVSEGDAVFYSCSVYDNLRKIQPWAESIEIYSIGESPTSNSSRPLLRSGIVLLVAVRKKLPSAG
jgi:SAM-dependent methyltransferase